VVNTVKPTKKPDLYVIGIGVSQYKNDEYSLHYAAIDMRDLLKVLGSATSLYASVKTLPILDTDATIEGIAKAKDFLAPAQIDNVVIVFAAGHGLLDDKARYYFATHDIDFEHPGARGLAFDQLEGIVANTKGRHRLILMDTCASGETDEEEVARGRKRRAVRREPFNTPVS